MAKAEQKNIKKKTGSEKLPFTKANYQILAVGIVVITLGFIALSQSPWDGTMPLVVAPILLVIGYLVIIPVGILYRQKTNSETTPVTPGPASKA